MSGNDNAHKDIKLNQEQCSEKDKATDKIESKVDEIKTLVTVLKSIVDSLHTGDSQQSNTVYDGIKFGDSKKDRLIKRIASGLPEILTRNALSKAIGEYFSAGTLANFDSQNAISILVPVKFRGSKKKAYTKESVILYLYAELMVGDENDMRVSKTIACRKAS